MLEIKMTFNGKRPTIIKSLISQQPLIGSSSNFRLKLRGPDQYWILLEMKTTSDGRRPQNIKSGVSKQPLIRSSSIFKQKQRVPYQN
jgi:hypothetical protein